MITVWVDELTPCLKDNTTGDIVETEVIRIRRSTFLSKFSKKTGWYVSWTELLKENEIYALVLKGTVDIQGLVAIRKDDIFKACFISWMVAAPQNNNQISSTPRFSGVGGHLFAIACRKSIEFGYGGAVAGYAANMELVRHYVSVFHAEHIPALHPFQIFIDEGPASEIINSYDYNWTEEEI